MASGLAVFSVVQILNWKLERLIHLGFGLYPFLITGFTLFQTPVLFLSVSPLTIDQQKIKPL